MDLVYDAPWWFYILPIVVGAAMALMAIRKGDKPLRNVGLALLLIGIGIFATSRLVETDSEVVTRQAYEVVAAIEKQQWDELSSLLDPGAMVTLLNAGTIYENRAQIIEACKSQIPTWDVTDLTITHAEATVQGGQITTEIEVYVTATKGAGRPLPSTWRLVWAQRGGKWLVRDIEAIQIPGVRGRLPTLQ